MRVHVVCLPGVSMSHAERLHELIKEHLPNERFLLLSGASSITTIETEGKQSDD